MQLSAAVFLLCTLFAFAAAQPNCGLSGSYTCSGGNIRGLEFGDDEDDDFFKYYLSDGNSECSLFQEGTYLASATASTISTTLGTDDDECVIVGENQANCNCVTSLSLTAADGCDTLTVSGTGEVCTSNEQCSDSFTCAGGQNPQPRPGYTPDANGCGPSALPLAGPSFGFLDCCTEHDFCYGTCGTDRAQCDNDFYACMYCICQDSDNFVEEAVCEELACNYFQAVDEFGCPSFRGGQEDSCVCDSKDAVHEPKAMKNAPSKFGPGIKTQRQTELFCDAPFTPATCASTTRTPSNSPAANSPSRTPTPSPEGNRDITSSRTPSPSRNINTGTTPSRTSSPIVAVTRVIPVPGTNSLSTDTSRTSLTQSNTSNDDDDDSTNTISATFSNTSDDDDDDSTNTLSASFSLNNDDDDDNSSASAVVVGSLLLAALLVL